jgi:putative ABC transport system permease protein
VSRIALGTLGSRRGGILGALAAVTLAIVLVSSSGIVVESTLRAQIPVDRLDAAEIVVQRSPTFHLPGAPNDFTLRERTRIDGRLAAGLRRIPGVERALPDRTFAAELAADGRPFASAEGHGWSSAALEPLAVTQGREPRSPRDVVLDAGLAGAASLRVGDAIGIRTAFGGGRFTVAGIAAPSPEHGPTGSPGVFFRDDVAADLSGTGERVGLIGIVVRPGADVTAVAGRVREAVRPLGLRVLTGSRRGEAESLESMLGREDVLAGLSVFGSFAAFVAIFVVASAFALSVQQRHRELALLRAIGATPRQVRRMIAAEALAVAVAGTVLAIPAGLLAALAERYLLVRAGMLPSGFRLAIDWIPFALGLLVAIVTTQVAAFASGRRASRVRPVDALREASVESRPLTRLRAAGGLVALAAGVAVFVSTTRDVSGGGGDDAPAAGLVWMLAATLLGPLLALPFVWLVGLPLMGLSGGPGLLARANARANLRRFVSVATPLVLTVSLGCALLFSRAVVEHATGEQVARSVVADHVLVPSGDGLLPDVAAAARRLPGVRSVAATFATSVVVATETNASSAASVTARAVDTADLARTVDLQVTAGSAAGLRGATVAVDERRARRLGWRVGDRVRLWLGDGSPVRLRVVALFRRPLGFGEVVLPRRVVETHVTDPLDDAVFVATAGSDGPARKRLARLHGVEVLTGTSYVRRIESSVRRESIAVLVLLGIVVLFSAVAAVNALAVAITERARELELLRLIGATRRQLTRMIRFEVLLIVAFATTVGMLTAAPGVVVFSYGKTGSFVPEVPAWLYVGLPACAVALAVAASALPTRTALRTGRGSVTAGVE